MILKNQITVSVVVQDDKAFRAAFFKHRAEIIKKLDALGAVELALFYSNITQRHYVVFAFLISAYANKARERNLCLPKIDILAEVEQKEMLDAGVHLPMDATEVNP